MSVRDWGVDPKTPHEVRVEENFQRPVAALLPETCVSDGECERQRGRALSACWLASSRLLLVDRFFLPRFTTVPWMALLCPLWRRVRRGARDLVEHTMALAG